jgi:transcription initiation factor TFIIB
MSVTALPTPIGEACPTCGGLLTSDQKRAETVCTVCALVVESDQIDYGAEWRAYDHMEEREKSRVGPPATSLIHDKGRATRIDWRNQDARGNPLSQKQRRRAERLRSTNKRYLVDRSEERSRSYGNKEIQRMASCLEIVPDPAAEYAGRLFRSATKHDVLSGRSVEAVATACLFIAIHKHGVPLRLVDVLPYSRVDDGRTVRQARLAVADAASLAVPPVDPTMYIERIAANVPGTIARFTVREARGLLDQTPGEVVAGRSPYCLAASALYAGARIRGEDVTQKELATAADVGIETIREQYRKILTSTGHDDLLDVE